MAPVLSQMDGCRQLRNSAISSGLVESLRCLPYRGDMIMFL
jgi:hypothetical protein